MRNLKLLAMLLATITMTFIACEKDDDDPAIPIAIAAVDISEDNSTITLTFNQGVFGNFEKTNALENDAFELSISNFNQDATFFVTHTAGQATVTINLVYENQPDGDETIDVIAKAAKVFGEKGNPLDSDLSILVNVNSREIQISELSIGAYNDIVNVKFNQPVYKTTSMTGNLDEESFFLDFTGNNEVNINYTVDHLAGEKTVTINIEYLNRVDDDQMLEVSLVENKIFNTIGETTSSELTESVEVNEIGIIGKWSAYDISFILQSVGFDDSLYANFYKDQSYMVTAFQGGIPIIFEGAYEMTKTEFDDIWEIELNQSVPASVISEGIFKVFPAAQDSMWYEVAQVDPAIAGVTPPTAEAGFGSTSGGAFGTGNIQKYYWVGQE